MKTGLGGIAIHSINFMVTDYLRHINPQFHLLIVSCSVCNNYIKSIEGDTSGTGVIFTKSNPFFLLNNTALFNNKATGILGMSSNIILSHNVTIVNNTGSSGGGILLCQNAVIYLEAFTNVTIAHNTANHTGGGISIETEYLESKPICFFQLGYDPLINASLVKTINISLYDNHAGFAGSNIFGGSIDYCYMIDSPKHKANRSTDIYHAIFSVPNNREHPSSVTSPPRRVCLCENNKTTCNDTSHSLTLHVFPGQTFPIEVVLVGQFNGSVPGTVQATLKHSQSTFELGESIQKISDIYCTNLSYTINTKSKYETIELEVQHVGDISGFEQSYKFERYQCRINIKMKDCPVGFAHTYSDGSLCDCNWLFSHHKNSISCEIKNQTIKRVPPVWIGYVETDKGTKTTAYHSHCPLDYCVSTNVYLLATNDSLSQDEQCAFNRTGMLCGSCSAGLSIVLGSFECHPCSNYWLLLNIPFALIGILLVIVLTLCNVTIANGTLSGLIFYCNIIRNNISVFFPGENISFLTPLLKMFVSVANLEFGMSLCFFDGMDSYTKAWLHFGYPLYLWLITGIIIYLGNRCSWIIRRNAVKVLATLILLSYTRLIGAVTVALQVSYVYLQDGGYEQRWLTDGNIKYFKGKHVPLAIFATLFSLLLFTFALCLFFIQCLQKVSHCWAFSWVNHFKPIFDAYTGPFTSDGRFWTGLLLLLRGILFVVSAVNSKGDPRITLSTIAVTLMLLLTVALMLPFGLYRHRCLNALECLSLLNLGVLASLLFVHTNESLYSVIIPHISVSIALLTCVGIILYHITRLNLAQRFIHNFCYYMKILQCSRLREMITTVTIRPTESNDVSWRATFPHYKPFNEDREPLLATNNEE